jgi:hypothetical protein
VGHNGEFEILTKEIGHLVSEVQKVVLLDDPHFFIPEGQVAPDFGPIVAQFSVDL